jgi:hypothetical protein
VAATALPVMLLRCPGPDQRRLPLRKRGAAIGI